MKPFLFSKGKIMKNRRSIFYRPSLRSALTALLLAPLAVLHLLGFDHVLRGVRFGETS